MRFIAVRGGARDLGQSPARERFRVANVSQLVRRLSERNEPGEADGDEAGEERQDPAGGAVGRGLVAFRVHGVGALREPGER